jgi:hypothetical protein
MSASERRSAGPAWPIAVTFVALCAVLVHSFVRGSAWEAAGSILLMAVLTIASSGQYTDVEARGPGGVSISARRRPPNDTAD